MFFVVGGLILYVCPECEKDTQDEGLCPECEEIDAILDRVEQGRIEQRYYELKEGLCLKK